MPSEALQKLPGWGTALRIALIYAAFSVLWILLSDQILLKLAQDVSVLTRFQMIKGWVFVLLTAALIYGLLQRENRRTRQATIALARQHQRMCILQELNEKTGADLQEIYDFSVDAAVRVTESDLGFFASLEGPSNRLSILAWSGNVLPQCGITDRPFDCCTLKGGLWAETIRTRHPLIINDYAQKNPGEKGFPQGHVDIRRFLCVPVFDGTEIVAIAGVANRSTPYTATEATHLTLFMQGVWRLVDRRRNHERLEQLRSLLGDITDSMPSTLITVDPEGTVTHWNAQAQRQTGLSPQQAIGRPLSEIYPLLSDRMDTIRQATREHRSQQIPRLHYPIGGEERFGELTIYPLSGHSTTGAVLRLDDITDRVRMEERMIQSEKMLSLGGLAAGMAHEINNPLAGILQNLQVLQNRLSPATPKNRRVAEACGLDLDALERYTEQRELGRLIETALGAGHRAALIVDNMLSFSRKSTSRFVYQSLPNLIESTLELAANDFNLAHGYDFKQIRLERDIAPDLPKVRCDANQMRQVIFNLIKNAAQAMYTVSPPPATPCLRFHLFTQGDEAVLEISDNGPGLSAEVRSRVFEPFFTTHSDGTGLGLAVSYFIVTETHGGSLLVDSSPGNGTRFSIRLPIEGRQS